MLPPVRSTKLCFFAPGRHRGDPPITSSPPDPAVGGVHTFWGGGQARGWGAPPRSRVVMGVSPHKQQGCRGGAGGEEWFVAGNAFCMWLRIGERSRRACASATRGAPRGSGSAWGGTASSELPPGWGGRRPIPIPLLAPLLSPWGRWGRREALRAVFVTPRSLPR